MGKALTVIGAANIDPKAAAVFCALQPTCLRVIYVIGHFLGKRNNEIDIDPITLIQGGLGILTGYTVTAYHLKYSLTPKEALLIELLSFAILFVADKIDDRYF